MATRKQPALATDDERAVFETAQSALETARMATEYVQMAHVAATLHHALSVIEGMRGRHVATTHQQLGQDVTLRSTSMRDLLHRTIVHDERALTRMEDNDPMRAEIEADIAQRREWIRQFTLMEGAVRQ